MFFKRSDVYTGGVDNPWIDLDALVADLVITPVLDASLPLRTHLLHADPETRASCLLVQFPPGWKRTVGTYACAEHAVVLEGEVILDGQQWGAGQGFVVPAGVTRQETYAPQGALAVAWFGGAPRWTSGGTPLAEPSCAVWNGDLATGVCDEVDAAQRRWRHNMEPVQQSGAENYVYQWPSP